ncbi:putative sugar transferase EpsL [bacterium HR29]|nr:putative sugar transferase EpsL [bacterium HR29]
MAKRALDVLLTVLLLPIAVPLTALMAAALAWELRGNPFFVQKRIGKDGRPFRMYKLRTMRDPRPGELRPIVVDDWDTFVFSPPGRCDPRVTRLGAFARKTSIDELPQLLNVLRGEMSLVGPRPELPEIVAQYPPAFHERHRVLPGIAGLAQVSGRSDLTYSETIAYDLCYIDTWSIWRDLRILARTLLVVARGAGAR